MNLAGLAARQKFAGISARILVGFFALMLPGSLWAMQAAQAADAPHAYDVSGMTIVPVALLKKLDFAHVKAGDALQAKVARTVQFPDDWTVPKGAVITGSVVALEKKPAAADGVSLLLLFDRIQMPDGQQKVVHVKVYNIYRGAHGNAAFERRREEQKVGPTADKGQSVASVGLGGSGLARTPEQNASQVDGHAEEWSEAPPGSGSSAVTELATHVTSCPGITLSYPVDGKSSVLLTMANSKAHLNRGTQMLLYVAPGPEPTAEIR
jgi:hypothetical protein